MMMCVCAYLYDVSMCVCMYVCGVCSIGMEGMQREVSLRLLKYGLELLTPYTFQSCKEDHNKNSRLDTHACSVVSTTHVNHPSIHPSSRLCRQARGFWSLYHINGGETHFTCLTISCLVLYGSLFSSISCYTNLALFYKRLK